MKLWQFQVAFVYVPRFLLQFLASTILSKRYSMFVFRVKKAPGDTTEEFAISIHYIGI
jgi:hypothetical protein